MPDDGGATGVSFAASVIGFHGIIIGAGARVSPETLTKDPMLRALTAAAKESAAVVIEEEERGRRRSDDGGGEGHVTRIFDEDRKGILSYLTLADIVC